MAQKIILTHTKANKYRNRKTVIDGIIFDSAKEARRYFELKILERNGLIAELERQVKFRIEINGVKICDFIADFQYVQNGEIIVEDVKSEATRKIPAYRLKNKLMLAVWGIKIKET
ncbi:MAG: DUF1064 domain-containing protein [Pyrinomonadaceae bacterium]|nr:DUF1064 domain-containing protein [Pyrinomonadaceae bacterium]